MSLEPEDPLASQNGYPDFSSLDNAASLSAIRSAMASLASHEASITSNLQSLLSTQSSLSHDLHRLDVLRTRLSSSLHTARSLSTDVLGPASTTAARLSSTVSRLDTEQQNIQQALAVVAQVSELKACVLGVTGSMGAAQDWEAAAGYLARARRHVPRDVLEGEFAARMVPTVEVPEAPAATLDSAAESLGGLFLREFERAAREGDGARVTRFFKLFPLIGKSEVGLDAYGRYVCQGVAARARANLSSGGAGLQRGREGFFYATALTKLFEHIAQIVDGHEPLVEQHYGGGMMARVVERLQMEADMQGGIVLDTWNDERKVQRRLTDIRSYAFSFLVQSFLPAQKGGIGTPRSSSPAVRDGSVATKRNSEEESVDMKEIDGILGEMAVMLGRWSLYCRFLASKCSQPDETKEENGSSKTLTMPNVLSECTLIRKISTILIDPFNAMSTFFFRRSVEKAFQLDEPPTDLTLQMNKPLGSNPPFITSAVDDVMYIVNQVIQRTVATSQRAVVTGVIPTVGRILGSDFIGMIQRKMRDESYPTAVIQGALPPEDKIIQFLVLINNLDIATDYIRRIVASQLSPRDTLPDDIDHPLTNSNSSSSKTDPSPPAHLQDAFPFDNDAATITTTLHSLESSFASKTHDLIADGISVAFHKIMKPRVRPILADAFRDADYAPRSTDALHDRRVAAAAADELSADAALLDEADPDAVRARFARAWAALVQPLRRVSSARNADRLLDAAVAYLSRALEKRIWAYYGRVSEVGAVRLERDVVGVVGAAVQGGRYGLRDRFERCVAIVVVMNMEEDEWEESLLENGADKDTVGAALSLEERRQARAIVKERGLRE